MELHSRSFLVVVLFFMSVVPSTSAQEALHRDRSTTVVSVGGVVVDSTVIDTGALGRFIVVFSAPALAHFHNSPGKRGAARAALEEEHAAFATTVAASKTEYELHHAFRLTFNGVAITTDYGSVEQLEKLPFVRAVYESLPVKAFSLPYVHDGSRPVSRLNAARNALSSLAGEGTTIAIVDTGIDYTHPDLGGGMGEGFKVVGGYDFVNDDADPMDDHGHGTHVAGIAAASGAEIEGVAPGAALLAYKVLDFFGGGFTDQVIAGVEQAVDPNGDGNMDDAADVINLSLGADPFFIDSENISGFEALNQSIANAVDMGVVVVAAAGNAGDSYSTIGYPANSPQTITVGAADAAGTVAPFSSRGPTPQYGLKPDLLAPGVDIRSTWPGAQYLELSGTSMAAPFIAGAAAVLRARHPDWTPADVKAAVMKAARDIGEDRWTQGAGLLQNIVTAGPTLSTTASLNFGLVDLASSKWEEVTDLKLRNLSDETTTYTLAGSGDLPGATMTLSPVELTLSPGQVGTVDVRLSIDVDATPYHAEFPHLTYINVSGGGEKHDIPVSFVKSGYLDLALSGPRSRAYYIFDADNDELVAFGRSDSVRVLLDPGLYNVLARFNDHSTDTRSFIYERRVSVQPVTAIRLQEDDAEPVLILDTVDENGAPFSTPDVSYMLSLWHETAEMLFVTFGGSFQFSNDGTYRAYTIRAKGLERDEFSFEWDMRTDINADVHYVYKGVLEDFSLPLLRPHTEQEFVAYTVEHQLPDTVQSASAMFIHLSDVLSSISFTSEAPLRPPIRRRVFEAPDPFDGYPSFAYHSVFYALFDGEDLMSGIEPLAVSISPRFQVHADRRLTGALPFSHLEHEPYEVRLNADDIAHAELGPFMWSGRFENSSMQLRVLTNTTRGARWYLDQNFITPYLPLFASQLRGGRPDRARYSLYDAQGVAIGSGRFNVETEEIAESRSRSSYAEVALPSAGLYTLNIKSPAYMVYQSEGAASVRATVDTRRPDANPPTMQWLHVFDGDGRFSDHVENEEAVDVQFALQGQSAASLRWRKYGDAEWTDAAVSFEDGAFAGTLPQTLSDTYVDLQIEAVDDSGNMLEYTAVPALAVGSPGIVTSTEPVDPVITAPLGFALHPNYPNPFNPSTRLRYDLSEPSPVRLHVFDVLGRVVRTLVDGKQAAGHHRIDFDAADLPSGIYFYRLQTPRFSATRRMILLR